MRGSAGIIIKGLPLGLYRGFMRLYKGYIGVYRVAGFFLRDFPKIRAPSFGVLIIGILLFRVLY